MKISLKQHRAIPLLASGKTCREVAAELDVTPQTISEWKRQPAFVAEINKLRKEVIDAARAKLQQSTTEAVDELLKLMHEAPNPETRRRAAVDVLRIGGFEPASREVYGLGIGPVTADGVREKWKQEEEFRELLSRI